MNKLEYLAYGNYKGELFIRELPFLTLRKKFTAAKDIPILSILLSRDERYLLCGCGDGEITVLVDPNHGGAVNPTNSPTNIKQSAQDPSVKISNGSAQLNKEASPKHKF